MSLEVFLFTLLPSHLVVGVPIVKPLSKCARNCNLQLFPCSSPAPTVFRGWEKMRRNLFSLPQMVRCNMLHRTSIPSCYSEIPVIILSMAGVLAFRCSLCLCFLGTPNPPVHLVCVAASDCSLSALLREMYVFLGTLFGIALRTKVPLSLDLPSLIWKPLVCGRRRISTSFWFCCPSCHAVYFFHLEC